MPADPMQTVSFRLPSSLNQALKSTAQSLGYDTSHCFRQAIQQYLDAGPNSVERRLALLERRLATLAPVSPEIVLDAEVQRLEAELAAAKVELEAAKSFEATLVSAIESQAANPGLLSWWTEFRKQHRSPR